MKCSVCDTGEIDEEIAKEVTLSIRDDGQGFDRGQVQPDHLGLEIMRERAENIGAQLAINSELEKGTSVKVTWKEDEFNRLNED
jgi:nitrate/nitrite-specific signal transduction histidine kinase